MIRSWSAFVVAAFAVWSFAVTRPASAPSTIPAVQPVPLLSPEEEAKTFNLPPGLHAEVVAAEPMVQHPVAIAWDPDGRLFVAEMRGYMPDTEGWGENKPTGRISILQDSDGDGRMDQSTVFLDRIILPRAVGFAGDGVLVGTPPKLLFCRDINGDGRADTTEMIAGDFGFIENPEHGANGLVYNLDNWIYCANYTKRLRYRNGKFEFSPIPDLGQFGLSRDDFGRLFFNTNSDYLRASLVPPHYSSRNPTSPIALADTRIADNQKVWPAHETTVNRGYREGFLRDGRLDEFTAACSPHIYRATLLGPDFYGNAFVCEPSANLVRRAILRENDGLITAKNAYDRREFIASTYERFRPVNVATGPDGALYVVDMHHGLIQHRMWLTDWAKEEYRKKQLNKHNLTGRIFRIVPDNVVPSARPRLRQATTSQLMQQLTHPNAWWRETAQRLLVERNDRSAVAPLAKMARGGKEAVHRVTALWTLDGMGALDHSTLRAALKDDAPKVRANALRLCERSFLHIKSDSKLEDAIRQLARDTNTEVRLQYVLCVVRSDVVASVLADAGDNRALREAAVTGLSGREILFLRQRLDDSRWSQRTPGRASVFTDVARSVIRRNKAQDVAELVDLIGEQPASRRWQQLAMLEAIPPALEDEYGATKLIKLSEKPKAIDRLASSDDADVRNHATRVAALFDWPGNPTSRPAPVPLTPRQQELFELGRTQYALACAQCHKVDGLGQEGKTPPLLNSRWVLGNDKRLARIILHGMRGPIAVGDTTFNLDMPAMKAMSDDQIAAVLTFIRRSWGHQAPPVDPATVQNVREWNQARRDGWTVQELLEVR